VVVVDIGFAAIRKKKKRMSSRVETRPARGVGGGDCGLVYIFLHTVWGSRCWRHTTSSFNTIPTSLPRPAPRSTTRAPALLCLPAVLSMRKRGGRTNNYFLQRIGFHSWQVDQVLAGRICSNKSVGCSKRRSGCPDYNGKAHGAPPRHPAGGW
jgi:hypothetical protein